MKRLNEVPRTRPGVFVPAAMASALAALPGGALLYAEQRSGRVFEVSADGTRRTLVAEIDVATNGDRGLLGLAVDPSGKRRFASWVAPDGRFEVGELTPGGVVPVWIGPATAETENGGRIAWAPRGLLVFGAGAQADVVSRDDPTALHGRLVEIEPAGMPLQVPRTLSAGWNDPSALAYDAAGHLWVADAAPPGAPRIARGDLDAKPTEVTTLAGGAGPTGLRASGPQELVLCASGDRTVQRYSTAGGRAELSQDQVTPCRYDVEVLTDGRWAVALDDGIRIDDPPPVGTGASS